MGVNNLEAILYGFIQGMTEYLPISSSAHLILLPKFLGQKDPGLSFNVLLHFGTLCSTLAYFWKDWWQILKNFKLSRWNQPLQKNVLDWRLLVLGTIPALLAGALLHSLIKDVLRGVSVIVVTLAVGGVLLWAVDRFSSRVKKLSDVSFKDALWIGIGQACALIPGVSRSGATILTARYLGFDRETSAKFSFLLSLPIILAATVYELKDWQELMTNQLSVSVLVTATVSSFIFGLMAIGGLMWVLRKGSYAVFAFYRVALSLFLFAHFLF